MKYSGALAKPVTLRRIKPPATQDEFFEIWDLAVFELRAKLPALFEAHGVEYRDWMGLAIALARAHVAGFQIAPPPGRPDEWDAFSKVEFRLEVETLKAQQPKLSITGAIERIAKLPKWQPKAKGKKIEALKKHYYKADPRLVQLVRYTRANNISMDPDGAHTLEQWRQRFEAMA